jgi:SAM-dependent methyltransferase
VTTGHSLSSGVIWHDVECGAYGADLEAWEELASACSGPILELGCGTGRVCLHLARLGHEMWAVDFDGDLISAVDARARAEGLPVHAVQADAAELELGQEFELAIAAMQLIQMVGDERTRRRVLRRVAAHLSPGGRLGAAILDGIPQDLRGAPAPLPDVREVDGRIYSSLPVDVAADGDLLELRRLRQEVSPGGNLTESEHLDSLRVMEAGALEAEGEAVGMTAGERRAVPGVDGYVGSVIVVLERP